MASPPRPLCSCTKDELLRDIPDAKVTSVCPMCESAGSAILIAFHPTTAAVAEAAASSNQQAAGGTIVYVSPRGASSPVDLASPSAPEAEVMESVELQVVQKSPPPVVSPSESVAVVQSPAPVAAVKNGWVDSLPFGNNSRYTGNMRDGRAEGYGILVLPGEKGHTRYEGEWRANRPDGRGTQEEADGSVYKGEWRGGQRHGQGCLTDAFGRVVQAGFWHNDVLIKSTHATTTVSSTATSQAISQQYSPAAVVPIQGRSQVQGQQGQWNQNFNQNQNQTQVHVNIAGPRERTNHACHCLLFTFLGGLWLPCWIAACCDCACQHPCNS